MCSDHATKLNRDQGIWVWYASGKLESINHANRAHHSSYHHDDNSEWNNRTAQPVIKTDNGEWKREQANSALLRQTSWEERFCLCFIGFFQKKVPSDVSNEKTVSADEAFSRVFCASLTAANKLPARPRLSIKNYFMKEANSQAIISVLIFPEHISLGNKQLFYSIPRTSKAAPFSWHRDLELMWKRFTKGVNFWKWNSTT